MKVLVLASMVLIGSSTHAQGLTDAIGAIGNAVKPSVETNVQLGLQTGGQMTNAAVSQGEGSTAVAGQNALIDASQKSGIKTNIQLGLQTGGTMTNSAMATDGGMAAAGQNSIIKK